MRIWALNLPQFYETLENNEWWGQGYTEWTAVKGAKPLYKGHIQPLVPFNGNYRRKKRSDGRLNWRVNMVLKALFISTIGIKEDIYWKSHAKFFLARRI